MSCPCYKTLLLLSLLNQQAFGSFRFARLTFACMMADLGAGKTSVPEPKGLPPPSSLTSEHHPLFKAYSVVQAAMIESSFADHFVGDAYNEAVEKLYVFFKQQAESEQEQSAEEEYEEIVVEEDEWDAQIPLCKNKRFVKSKAAPPKRKWTTCKATIVKK